MFQMFLVLFEVGCFYLWVNPGDSSKVVCDIDIECGVHAMLLTKIFDLRFSLGSMSDAYKELSK